MTEYHETLGTRNLLKKTVGFCIFSVICLSFSYHVHRFFSEMLFEFLAWDQQTHGQKMQKSKEKIKKTNQQLKKIKENH